MAQNVTASGSRRAPHRTVAWLQALLPGTATKSRPSASCRSAVHGETVSQRCDSESWRRAAGGAAKMVAAVWSAVCGRRPRADHAQHIANRWTVLPGCREWPGRGGWGVRRWTADTVQEPLVGLLAVRSTANEPAARSPGGSAPNEPPNRNRQGCKLTIKAFSSFLRDKAGETAFQRFGGKVAATSRTCALRRSLLPPPHFPEHVHVHCMPKTHSQDHDSITRLKTAGMQHQRAPVAATRCDSTEYAAGQGRQIRDKSGTDRKTGAIGDRIGVFCVASGDDHSRAGSHSRRRLHVLRDRRQPGAGGDGQLWRRLEREPVRPSRLSERERVKAAGLPHKAAGSEGEGCCHSCTCDAAKHHRGCNILE